MDLLAKFGRDVRIVRKERQLSQEDLAELAGVHRTYIGAVERGEKNVSLRNIARIAQALDVKIHELTKNL